MAGTSKGKILVVDDEASLRLYMREELSREGYTVDTASDGEEALSMVRENFYHVVLLDILMPKVNGTTVLKTMKDENIASEIIILTGNATVESAIECMKAGAFEYIKKPFNKGELVIQIERALERQHSQIDKRMLQETLAKSGQGGTIIGTSKAIVELRRIISQVAPNQSTVLILGESGSGKELVARSIHEQSLNSARPFVPINCASLSEHLLESELFGYEKGAFTDAKAQKRGLAEIADGGTLFLDEIGEIPLYFQAKLLRFIETGEIRRVGGIKNIKLNVRILCATNRPLEELVRKKEFRDDLFYRLNVLTIRTPPLREHVEDIGLLVEHFLKLQNSQKKFSQQALKLMQLYDWPGNVRELKNVVERSCILCPSQIIDVDYVSFLKADLIKDTSNSNLKVFTQPPNENVQTELISLKELERRHIIAVLSCVKGHKGKAAKILQVTPKTLYHKMKAYNIVSTYR